MLQIASVLSLDQPAFDTEFIAHVDICSGENISAIELIILLNKN